jgi:hypothetical protein
VNPKHFIDEIEEKGFDLEEMDLDQKLIDFKKMTRVIVQKVKTKKK